LNWTAGKTANWISLSATGGSLTAGGSTTVTASLNSAADSLTAGSYSDTVNFVNTSTGNGNTNRSVSLAVNSAAQLAVSPADGLSSSGPVGGPFSPSSIIYTLTNSGASTLNWTASKSQDWANLSSAGGELAAGASTTVTVSINGNAASLTASSYSDTVNFVNTSTGNGNTSRSVSLAVNSADQLALYITNATLLGNDFVLSFNTQTGQDYTVEYADALPAPAWSNLITRPGNGALVTVTNQNARDGQRYFRVRTR
jgi:hypothetical protein